MVLLSQMTNLSQEHNNPWGLDQEWEIAFMSQPKERAWPLGIPPLLLGATAIEGSWLQEEGVLIVATKIEFSGKMSLNFR